jgi:hypothetical protein
MSNAKSLFPLTWVISSDLFTSGAVIRGFDDCSNSTDNDVGWAQATRLSVITNANVDRRAFFIFDTSFYLLSKLYNEKNDKRLAGIYETYPNEI